MGGLAVMRSLDYVISMNNAKEPKYKDLVKLPKRAVMYLGRIDHFEDYFVQHMEWKSNKLLFEKEDEEIKAAAMA